ncbi:bis-aminopropyl spermidine synthase family protein [Virgibacillus salarius]|uniref:bis-aminopropyl spermidine synthase family protein n=1 Tax=Virgibacillus salarius TaxID=447199 RepID=UPI0031D9DDA5
MDIIEQVGAKLDLEEGTAVIEQVIRECYVAPGISTKNLARRVHLPVPVTVAVKKELMKKEILKQDRGVRCTVKGNILVEQELDFQGLNKTLYHKLISIEANWLDECQDVLAVLNQLFAERPQVDVQLDQSQCTAETSLRRAILCLKEHALIGKRILCIGDDDLVSISIGLLLKKLFPAKQRFRTVIHVMDIDCRFLQFISDFTEKEGLPITCIEHDMRYPLGKTYVASYDCFFTDPPYTLNGLGLFLARGIQALKSNQGRQIFLSFAHKSPEFMLEMNRLFVQMGLSIVATYPNFNSYVGAQMIANQSQMLILKTTAATHIADNWRTFYTDPIYTGELKQSERIYSCKHCGEKYRVGYTGRYKTIEQLKQEGCPNCNSSNVIFILKGKVTKKR